MNMKHTHPHAHARIYVHAQLNAHSFEGPEEKTSNPTNCSGSETSGSAEMLSAHVYIDMENPLLIMY